MPGYILHVGDTMMWPARRSDHDRSRQPAGDGVGHAGRDHGRQAILVAGCPFVVANVPQPCLQVQWIVPATRVTAGGSPVIVQSSTGLCMGAAPQGPAERGVDADEGDGHMTDAAFPYALDARGRTAQAAAADHIEQMIEQVLFTAPGERRHRTQFGCGIMQLVFAPNDDVLAAAVNMTVQSALQQWLGDLIEIAALDTTAGDDVLTIDITYVVRATQQKLTSRFTRGA